LDEKRETVQALRKQRRAVTPAAFESLSCTVQGVARAKCIAGRNLESSEPDAHTRGAPGHISVVILADTESQPSHLLLATVKLELESARMLTTRVHVVGPRYLRLVIRLTIATQRGMQATRVQQAAIKRLQFFFDSRRGGVDEKGWQFGGNVYISDIYRVLGNLPEIESVMPTRDSAGKVLGELGVEPGAADRLRHNSRGEIEAVVLRPDELVEVPTENLEILLPAYI
jgi:phage-related baseplate assembly protein